MVRNFTDEAVVSQSRDVTLGRGSFAHILEEPRVIVGSVTRAQKSALS